MTATETAGGFKPVHAAHAIEQVVVIIQFEQPLTDASILQATEALAQFDTIFPQTQDIRGVSFQVNEAGIVPISTSASVVPDGILRFLLGERGVMLKQLQIERQSLTFQTQSYTRWDHVWAEALSYIAAILPILENVSVMSFGLHYVDKFIWSGPLETCRPAALFRPDSPYLSARNMQSVDLWHCHSGQFQAVSAEVKRLEVVNIDCIDEHEFGEHTTIQPQRIIRVATGVTDLFNQPGFEPYKVSAQVALDTASQVFSALHIELKRVLSEIISDETATQVGLYAHESQ